MIRTDNVCNVKPGVDPTYYLKEYDDVLMGRRKTFSSALMAKEQGPHMCAELLRNIFSIYLHWTPVDVREKLTPEVVHRLKIAPLIKRIPCPPEVDPSKEMYYVAWYLYPETRNIQEPELIIKLYTDILEGKVKKFPGGYFDGNDGYLRAHILFLTMVREYLPPFENLDALYRFFASPEGKNCIVRYKLVVPLHELYGSALAFLHDSLPWVQKDEYLYQRYLPLVREGRTGKNYLPVTQAERDELLGLDTRAEDDVFELTEFDMSEFMSDENGVQMLPLTEGDEMYFEEVKI